MQRAWCAVEDAETNLSPATGTLGTLVAAGAVGAVVAVVAVAVAVTSMM